MSSINIGIRLLTIAFLLFSCEWCGDENELEKEEEDIIPTECDFSVDTLDFSFGIDYAHPEKYLIPGEQSDLSDSCMAKIRQVVGTPGHNISDVLSLCHWVNQNFTFVNAGGAMMGVNTAEELWEIKTFYGCHSLSLIISSTLREFGIPAVMIETAGIQWAYNYRDGTTQSFIGHVMSELYIDSTWILLDNNCTYVENYNPLNPFISMTYGDDLFTYAKGIDIWAYSGDVEDFTHNKMVAFSDDVHCYEELFNTVNYAWWD